MNRTKLHLLGASLILVALLFTTSCTVTERISFSNTSSHVSAFDFTVEDFFLAVLQDFSEFIPQEGEDSLMDKAIKDFERALNYSYTTRDVAFTKLNDNAYEGTFIFTNLMQLISDLGAGANQSLLKVEGKSLTFSLSMDNYSQLVPVIPFL
ncbi:MAG: hypothetical protein PHO72_03695, partial [Sphaerochaeta sp.]|nr:hypothetical protein [Sphaerochaeta sp.]